MTEPLLATGSSATDPHWYKDAVIYELHVKAYADANGDGIGDLRGLTERLDHVQSLGVNTIWLLPFYPSPLRDDGYDVADYEGVHPSYGTLEDFRSFVDEAHQRGLRVITELVVNHTSDQHPWFQAARRAPKRSPERAFYVWSDDPKLYSGTRIIFTDTEKSNWTWDEVAQQYYWHRFFSHQPDLNFDNPAVLEAVLKSMAFWLEMGVDGFRLDAIPYLVERDGTSNENLRETHDVIKQIRQRIDATYPGRLLLAEANMWPEDVREYFGDDDECHMAYHFPLMPRMYMAIAQEDRHPVVEILAQTPDIPANCQWAVFLRNHDELTLEMVTNKERDYLYKMYATDPRARINLGIRRRLAPLLENDRARIELMNSLLLSMPGTPVLYYGDEIGMGDNIFLGDRDGVRTPMQWSSDRNGGFSRADLQRLYLPPIQDPIYGFEALNVEAQSREPSSLLNWTRRMLAVRNSSRVFGRGSLTMLHPGNRKVLAYVRALDDEAILCVANVSRSAQPVELDLADFKGRVPVEMSGQNAFPPIGDLPYLLTLPAHGFFWFRLSLDAMPPRWHAETQTHEDLPTLVLFDGWMSLFRHRVVPWRMGLAETTRRKFEQTMLPVHLARQRWHAGAPDAAAQTTLADHAVLEDAGMQWLLALVDEQGVSGDTWRWFAPLALAFEDEDEERMRALAGVAVVRVRQKAATGVMAEAMGDEPFGRALTRAIESRQVLNTEHGQIHFTPTARFGAIVGDALAQALPVRRLTTRNRSVSLLGERLFLKAFRHLQPGTHPEVEMGRHLTEVLRFDYSVPMAGCVQYADAQGQNWALAMLEAQISHQGDAWSAFVDQLARTLESSGAEGATPQADFDAMASRVAVLATRVAALHAALARPSDDAAFAPQPGTAADLQHWVRTAIDEGQLALAALARMPVPADALLHTQVLQVAGAATQIFGTLASLGEQAQRAGPVLKTRLHGDLHLARVLIKRDDFIFTGFEGDATRNLAQRRAHHSALRDVASMLRSFSHARLAAWSRAVGNGAQGAQIEVLTRQWQQGMQAAFLRSYGTAAVAAGLYPDAAAFEATTPLRQLFELERALDELRFEIAHRPEEVGAPLAGIASLAGLDAPAGTAA